MMFHRTSPNARTLMLCTLVLAVQWCEVRPAKPGTELLPGISVNMVGCPQNEGIFDKRCSYISACTRSCCLIVRQYGADTRRSDFPSRPNQQDTTQCRYFNDVSRQLNDTSTKAIENASLIDCIVLRISRCGRKWPQQRALRAAALVLQKLDGTDWHVYRYSW